MPKPRLLYRRMLHAIDNHGVGGLLRRALAHLRPKAGRAAADEPARLEVTLHPFDASFGVDTGGYIPGERLGAPGGTGSDLYNTAYYGISPSTLRAALSHVPIQPEEFTFVDLGCGKGRALLVASELPFREVVGVELDPELCAVAAANAQRLPHGAASVRVLNQDALLVRYPQTPLLIYMYHPFLAPLLKRVLAEIERQFREADREIYLLFANAIYFDLLARIEFLEQVWDYDLPLSQEDAAADRHGTTSERYTLYRARR